MVALAARVCDGPRIRVAALLIRDGKVVLVRHRAGEATYHLLPGGGVRWGETLSDALCREVAEETGLECAPDRPILLSDTISPDGARHVVNIVFTAKIVGGDITQHPADARVECVDLVHVSQLADMDLRPPLAALVQAFVDDESMQAIYAGAPYASD